MFCRYHSCLTDITVVFSVVTLGLHSRDIFVNNTCRTNLIHLSFGFDINFLLNEGFIVKAITGWPTVLEFLGLFRNFFGTGNVLEKGHFFRLVLELFLNSEFLTSDFLGQQFWVAPCLDLPFVRKYYLILVFHVFFKNVKMFWNCSEIFFKILLATLYKSCFSCTV